jgi:hypothetical protein
MPKKVAVQFLHAIEVWKSFVIKFNDVKGNLKDAAKDSSENEEALHVRMGCVYPAVHV